MTVGLYRERKAAKERRAEGSSTRRTIPFLREGLRNIRVGSQRHRKLEIWRRKRGLR